MTTTLEQYTELVTSEHQDQPNFSAVLAAILQPFVDQQNTLESMPNLFDVDVATGVQLDAVGVWVGISRALRVPIADVYFSFDTVGLGFEQGVWFGPGDPATGIVNMDDDTYRLMIKAKIAANIWDGSLGHANQLLQGIFPTADVQLQDNLDMTQSFIISGTPNSELFSQLVDQGYLQIRPATVDVVPAP